MAAIPADYEDLFEKRTFAHFVTLFPDGTPHATPVWIGYDGARLLVNTATGRRKERNVRRDPRVALSMLDPDDPYRYLSVRGRVAAFRTEGAVEHINALSRRYTGESYDLAGEEGDRIVLEIEPTHVVEG